MVENRVFESDVGMCDTPPDNRIWTLEMADRLMLLPSMRTQGQLVPGLASEREDLPGRIWVWAGNGRLFCCRVLGQKFKWIKVPGPISKAQEVAYRLAENLIRQAMTPLEVADDLLAYVRDRGCTQEEAAEQLHLSAPMV